MTDDNIIADVTDDDGERVEIEITIECAACDLYLWQTHLAN